MAIPTRPVRWGIAPETPNFGGAPGNFGPVMTNGQEVAGPFFQPVEVVLEDDVPLKDIAEYFGRKCGNIQ